MSKKKLVCGVGVNDADYPINPRVNGKHKMCPYYKKWSSMMQRCYSDRYQKRQQTYIGCTVAKEWHSFMNFKKWMEAQDWKNKQLDKDILCPGNKIYSPETCLFVPSAINKIFLDTAAKRGKYPMGVYLNKPSKKYQASIKIDGKLINIGSYHSIGEAEQAYLKAKILYVKKHIDDNKHDDRLVSGLVANLKLIEAKLQFSLFNY
jgi:hypothetical protein